jgi:hypothetical protein
LEAGWVEYAASVVGSSSAISCECHKSRQDAGATRDEKRNSKGDWLDVVGYFFQVGYEAFHFFVAGGFVWGAENRGRVHCGHHVRS